MDGFSISVLTGPTVDAMKNLERRTDRATMWGLREVGRAVKREGRRRAPVLAGGPGLTSFRTLKKAGGKQALAGVSASKPIPGLLKASISSSRRLGQPKPHTYRLTVAPRGWRVNLYARKEEARTPYMQQAYEAVMPQVTEIYAKGWRRAMEHK